MQMSLTEARRRWSAAQGLDRRTSARLDEVVAATGWIRTLGGAEAYLGLAARAEGASVDAVHAAVRAQALRVMPAARGCIYLVPASDAPLALRLGERLSARRMARDLAKAGVAPGELEGLTEAILTALAERPQSTEGLRRALPDGAVRSLGKAGKAVGITTTLPPALRALEFSGALVRVPIDDRLDHERYLWVRAQPALAPELDDSAVLTAVARRYFQWAGPATLESFVSWSGLGKREASAAIDGAGLSAVEVEKVGAAWVADLGPVPAPGPFVALPSLDGLFGLRVKAEPLVDPRWRDVPTASFGRTDLAPLGSVTQALDRTLVEDGAVVGLWTWDPDRAGVVARRFDGRPVPAAVTERPRAVLAALGHGRIFSQDTDDAIRARVTRIASLSSA